MKISLISEITSASAAGEAVPKHSQPKTPPTRRGIGDNSKRLFNQRDNLFLYPPYFGALPLRYPAIRFENVFCDYCFSREEYISLPPIRGAVRVRVAEIIPIEPDAGNADEGNINIILLLYTPKRINSYVCKSENYCDCATTGLG